MDLSTFTRAGLKQTEIGIIVGVTQTTAGQWMRGKRQVHFLLEPKVEEVLGTVYRAVEEGSLPLSSTVPNNERLEKIKLILSEYQ